MLSVCLLGSPALAQLEMKTLTGLWLFDEGSGDVAADSSDSALARLFLNLNIRRQITCF